MEDESTNQPNLIKMNFYYSKLGRASLTFNIILYKMLTWA